MALGFFYQSRKVKHPEINLEALLSYILQLFSFMFQSHSKIWLVFFWCTFIFGLSFLVSTTSILVSGFLFSWSIYCSKFSYVLLALFHPPTPTGLKVFKVIFLNTSAKFILLVSKTQQSKILILFLVTLSYTKVCFGWARLFAVPWLLYIHICHLAWNSFPFTVPSVWLHFPPYVSSTLWKFHTQIFEFR